MARIEAPFTPEQVLALNHYQTSGVGHPFTCRYRDEHPSDEGILVAVNHGWICPAACDYEQNWAHDFMADAQAVAEMIRTRDAFLRPAEPLSVPEGRRQAVVEAAVEYVEAQADGKKKGIEAAWEVLFQAVMDFAANEPDRGHTAEQAVVDAARAWKVARDRWLESEDRDYEETHEAYAAACEPLDAALRAAPDRSLSTPTEAHG